MLRIGITGHRILTDKRKIEMGIDEVLSYFNMIFPIQEWTVLSSLAEGSDCLFVEKLLQYRQVKLVVPLPLSVERYMETFSNEAAKLLFSELYHQAAEIIQIEPKPTEEESFLTAGLYIVHHCEVLVTIWDGQDAIGLGGTGQIVEYAREKPIPMAWIRASNRQMGTKVPTYLEERQGTVIYERFPNQA
jgi:hypothetical protein